MPCAHTFAMHCAVSNKLFMHITAQLCSAVKNCDVHVLLQHLCDAMRSRACNALCYCEQAIYAYNGTTAQCSEVLWHTLLLQHPCNAGCSHTCNTQGCFEQPVCLWPHIRMLQPKLHSSASRVVVMLLLRSGSASKSQRVAPEPGRALQSSGHGVDSQGPDPKVFQDILRTVPGLPLRQRLRQRF